MRGGTVRLTAMLAAAKANPEQRSAERSHATPDNDLTPSLGWSSFALQKEWSRRKDGVAPWWSENSRHTHAGGCTNLGRALSNWSRARSGARAGAACFPRFMSRHRTTPSCTFTDGSGCTGTVTT